MSSSNNNQTGTIILGTLVGAAVGFAAGIILAPAKGSETRELIGDKATDWKKSINDVAAQAIDSLKEVRETAERAIKNETKKVQKVDIPEAPSTTKNL